MGVHISKYEKTNLTPLEYRKNYSEFANSANIRSLLEKPKKLIF